MARIDGFCIDRYEAHLLERTPSGREIAHSPYERPRRGGTYVARSLVEVVPQAYVSRIEASDACRNAGKRLCALVEWHRACSGPKRDTYPYGPEERSGWCNTGRPHVLAQLFGRDPRRWSYEDHFNSPRLNREGGQLALTGAHPRCTNDWGVYDMVGNLHEWVSDRVDWTLPQKITLRADIQARIDDNFGKGIFMGGFYSTTDQHGPGCLFLTPGHGPRYHDYSTGFRCCADLAGPPSSSD